MHNIHIVHLPDMVVNVLLNVTVSQNLQMVNADTTALQLKAIPKHGLKETICRMRLVLNWASLSIEQFLSQPFATQLLYGSSLLCSSHQDKH